MNSKIQNEIKELVQQQVISQEIASEIEAYYHSKKSTSPNRLFTVFGVLGSLLVGLGIILILAHNWDNFSKITKTLLAFLPLIIGQGSVGFSILKNKSTVWKEASGTFLFFAVGSSISLISQIYNIPEDFNAFLLTWILLCAPLIYLLKSNTLGILHIVFMTYYAIEFGFDFLSTGNTPWYYLLLLVIVLPHYWQLIKYQFNTNITSIFNWLLPLSLTIVLIAFINDVDALGILMYVILFGLLYNIGKLPKFDNGRLRQNGYLILGSLGTVYMLMITSFDWFWDDLIKKPSDFNSQEAYISLVLFIIALGILVYSYIRKQIKFYNISHYAFIIFTVVFLVVFSNKYISIALINLLILVIALITIKIGTNKFHFGILNYGLLIIAILIVCRFFDTDMSFIIRGLLFVGFGLGFFLANYFMFKKQKKRKMNLK
ncbi:DUF2157 domain-containing protein [Seonamhaeicola aphaedonensis]|uniref:Putative membrane protein n=1 Tax=Seonamhaeicola aphaedonensis TaxID=1461338 RepID=A0A3D9HEL6_9FLAO|nr:DUF2157 domain-containing protein [Seonamhaeicola aphaedonensis]RED47924.1 putative membrane protein [Seonamhaeicola aphaedonensis]